MPRQHVNKFKLELRNRYAILEEQQDLNYKNIGINDLNDNIIKPLVDAAKNWRSSSEKANKFSEETRKLMEKRSNLKVPTTAREKIANS